MAATQTSRAAPFGAITTFRFFQFFSGLHSTFGNWNDARVTRNALGKLSDRDLDDIGLCRGDVDRLGA